MDKKPEIVPLIGKEGLKGKRKIEIEKLPVITDFITDRVISQDKTPLR